MRLVWRLFLPAGLILLAGCSERGDRFYQQALSLAEEGKFAQAESTLHQLIALEPEEIRGHLALAAVFRARNEFEAAIDELEKSLALAARSPEPAYALGCIYQEMGKKELAGSRFQAALERDPGHLPSIYRLAGLKQEEGDLEPAVVLYRRLLELNPASPAPALNNLGALLWRMGQKREALELFARARQEDSKPAAVLFNFGMASLETSADEAQAVRALREYLKIEPPPPDRALVVRLLKSKGAGAYDDQEQVSPQESVEKGMVQEGQGALEAARECYLEALRVDPRNIQAHYRLGLLYDDRLGDRYRAIEAYEAFLDLHRNPKSELVAEVLRRLGRARRELGDAAVTAGRRLPPSPLRTVSPPQALFTPTPPRDTAYYLAAGRRAEKSGNLSDALEAYRRAAGLDSASAEARLGEGRVHQTMGRYREARSSVQESMEIRVLPGSRELLAEIEFKLAEIAESDGDLQAAADHYRRAGRDQTARLKEWEQQESLYRKALAAGRKEEAAGHLRRMTSLKPDDPDSWLALGDLRYESDPSSAEAREAYRNFLRHGPRRPEAERVRGRLSRVKTPPTPAPRPDAKALYSRGVAAQQAGRLDAAAAEYRAALEADPKFFPAAYNLGVVHARKGDHRAALAAYKQAAAANPDFAPVQMALFKLYYYQFQMPGPAREHAAAYLRLEPSGPQAESLRKWLGQQ